MRSSSIIHGEAFEIGLGFPFSGDLTGEGLMGDALTIGDLTFFGDGTEMQRNP